MTTTQTKSKILSDNWALKMFIWAAGNIAFQKARNNLNKGKDVLIAAAIGGTAGILEDICSNTINHGKGFGSGVVSGALSGYITQLKSFVRKNGSKFNITEQDIKTAVELHNKTYKRSLLSLKKC